MVKRVKRASDAQREESFDARRTSVKRRFNSPPPPLRVRIKAYADRGRDAGLALCLFMAKPGVKIANFL